MGNWQTWRWCNDATRRYYEVRLQQDLWGDWVLTTIWGGIGTQRGRIRNHPLADYRQGVARLEVIDKLRRRHGYRRQCD